MSADSKTQGKKYVPRKYEPMPLDFLILEVMPEQGMIGGVHWKGKRVADIASEINERSNGSGVKTKGTMIDGRMRSLKHFGYTKDFASYGTGGTRIWARTPEGTKLLANKEAILNG